MKVKNVGFISVFIAPCVS